MRFHIILTTMFMAAATAAHADDRFICSGDDTDVRFTVDVGFDMQPGIHLNHFRGALAVKKRGVSAGLGKRLFDSEELLQSWWHGRTLRLDVLDPGGRETDRQKFSLVIGATRGNEEDESFSGNYKLVITGSEDPFVFEGKVNCTKKG